MRHRYLSAWIPALYASLWVAALDMLAGGESIMALATSCRSNVDCACGWNDVSKGCEIGSAGQVDVDKPDCSQFCHGFDYQLVPVCRSNACVRAHRSPCPGDCDADAVVTVAEVVAAVDIALGDNLLATCGASDPNADGKVTIDELLRSVVAALDGCAAAIPPRSDILGVYDTSITFDGQSTVLTPSTRSISNDPTTLLIGISPNEDLWLNGIVVPDAEFALDGQGNYTDILYSIRGSARQTGGPNDDRIEGTVYADPASFAPFMAASFVMQRHSDDPARFAGWYRVQLSVSPGGTSQASSLLIGLDVATSGVAVLLGGTDVGMDGVTLGTVTPGSCMIAGGGSLACYAEYFVNHSSIALPFRLIGKLDALADTVSGSGRYLAGVDPPLDAGNRVGGGWAAARISPAAAPQHE